MRLRLPPWTLAIPAVIFLAHAALFRNWLIDDAAISFSYSRNLALGFGLVPQPGAAPVEAYSNFLWVLLLAPFFLLHLFEPYLTLKTLSVVFVLASFGVIYRSCRSFFGAGAGRAVIPLVLTLISANTAFVVWTTSGLENPLYVLLSVLLLAGLFKARPGWGSAADRPRHALGLVISLGLLAAALGMTRPDGVIFALAYPLLWLAEGLKSTLCRGSAPRPARLAGVWPPLRSLLIYAAAFAIAYGAFRLFSLAYFGDLLPNTYYAKGGPSAYQLISLLTLQPDMMARIQDLTASLVGHAMAGPALVALYTGTLYLVFTGRFRRHHGALLAMLSCSAVTYLLLPNDGMGEYRFGTLFVLFCNLFAGLVAHDIFSGTRAADAGASPTRGRRVLAAVALAALVLAGSAFLFVRRSLHFAAYPPIPFSNIVEDYGDRYDRFAAALSIPEEQASVLLPDLGGTLYTSHIRIYDLGMLADKTIARTLGSDQARFYDYVFDTVRPTFIHLHDTWTYLARMDDDPRFRRDYTPVYEHRDAWAMQRHGLTLFSGDYVRKDALQNAAPGALDDLRERWRRRAGFNEALYWLVAGDEAAAEQAYSAARAGATRAEMQRAIRDVEAFLLIYPEHPQGVRLRDRLQHDVAPE